MFFKKNNQPKNIKEILKQFKELERKVDKISQSLESLQKDSKLHIQKVGMVRYNPFSNVGGDQSFSIALLNNNNNGIIITSLYAQDSNRVYSKPVENGKSQYSLSQEEEKAIKKAVGS